MQGMPDFFGRGSHSGPSGVAGVQDKHDDRAPSRPGRYGWARPRVGGSKDL